MSAGKGFNFIVVESAEVLEKYKAILNLGECKSLATEFEELDKKLGSGITEMARGQARRMLIADLPADGNGQTYYLIADPRLLTGGGALHVYNNVLLDHKVPQTIQFVANRGGIFFEKYACLYRCNDERWKNALIEAGIYGNFPHGQGAQHGSAGTV